ncbi:MAG: stage III sporulation protein AE [Clostridia bacterium]|nr:stage III sporulation protein AE [Clostridia bacterium]
MIMTIKKRNYLNNRHDKVIKVIGIIILCLLLIGVFRHRDSVYAADNYTVQIEDELQETIISQLDEIDFKELNLVLEDFNKSNNNLFSISNIKSKIYSIISGENAINYSNLISSLFSGVIDLFLSYLPIVSLIIVIAIVSNLLNGIKSKFNEKSTGNLIHLVCFLTVVILVVGMVTKLATSTGKSISSMVKQSNILFPILITLMTATGGGVTAGTFQPIVAILSTYISDIFSYFIMPLFMLSFVFDIISNFSDSIKLDKFSSFISSFFKWSVGIVFTLFFAIMTLQGISAGSFDNVSIRTTKYTIKSYVPIMGGYLSDGMDLILASTVLIKNSIGLVGVLLIINTILSPILEIVIFSLVMKLMSAIVQPLGDKKTSNFLNNISKSITMLSTCVIAIGFMYLITMGLVMTSASMVM